MTSGRLGPCVCRKRGGQPPQWRQLWNIVSSCSTACPVSPPPPARTAYVSDEQGAIAMPTSRAVAPQPAVIEAFFRLLYADVDEGHLVLSHLDTHTAHVNPHTGKPWLRSTWLDLSRVSLARAAAIAATLNTTGTGYYGVAFQRSDCRPAPPRRGTNAGAHTITSLWADIDLGYGAHAASALPATDAEALDFVFSFQTPPSLVLHSG